MNLHPFSFCPYQIKDCLPLTGADHLSLPSSISSSKATGTVSLLQGVLQNLENHSTQATSIDFTRLAEQGGVKGSYRREAPTPSRSARPELSRTGLPVPPEVERNLGKEFSPSDKELERSWLPRSGPYNSILSGWPFTINYHCERCVFYKYTLLFPIRGVINFKQIPHFPWLGAQGKFKENQVTWDWAWRQKICWS